MFKRPFSILLTLSMTGILWGNALSQSSDSTQKISSAPPLVQEICGVRPGKMNDSDIIKLYGEGASFWDPDHGRARYYTNQKHTYTLHVSIGLDKKVEDVEILKGLDIPQPYSLKKAVITNLPSTPTLNQKIELGMKQSDVETLLGKPTHEDKDDDILLLNYSTTHKEDKRVNYNYDAYYTFRNNKLIRFAIHDGE